MDKKFIVTADQPTAEKLKKLGYKLISEGVATFTFLNSGLSFTSDINPTKLAYTNILSI